MSTARLAASPLASLVQLDRPGMSGDFGKLRGGSSQGRHGGANAPTIVDESVPDENILEKLLRLAEPAVAARINPSQTRIHISHNSSLIARGDAICLASSRRSNVSEIASANEADS
jgi:hypothetical protein